MYTANYLVSQLFIAINSLVKTGKGLLLTDVLTIAPLCGLNMTMYTFVWNKYDNVSTTTLIY